MKSISATASSEEDAYALLKARASDAWGGIIRSATPSTTISELANIWLDDVQRRGKVEKTTLNTYATNVRTIINPNFGAYTIEQLDAGVIDHELLALSQTSPSKAQTARGHLRMMFKVAVRHRALAFNPVDAVESIRVNRPVLSALRDDQLEVLLEELKGWRGANPDRRGGGRPNTQQIADLLLLMLATSERIGEMVVLGRDDISVQDGVMYVHIWDTMRWVPGEGMQRKGSTKREDQKRRVPLPRFAEEVIRRRLAEYEPNPEGLLFPTRNGTALAPGNFRRNLRAFRDAHRTQLEAVGIDVLNLTPKTMRRTAATAVESGASLVDAQGLLGHRYPGTTSTSYIDSSRVVSTRASDAINNAFPSADGGTSNSGEHASGGGSQ